MNDDITRMLNHAAPEGPNPAGWANAARRRSARRRAVGGAITAVAAAALIIPVSLSIRAPSTTTVLATASPSSPVQAGPGQLQPADCAHRAGDQDAGSKEDGSLPVGADRVWLCAETLTAFRTPPLVGFWIGTPEPLTIGVDDAIATFNALPIAQVKRCPPPRRYEATVVFEYPGGSRHIMGAVDGSCDEVGNRDGWQSYLSTLTGLWSHQREVQDTKFTREVQVCPATESLLQPRPQDAARGYVCPDDFQTEPQVAVERSLPSLLVSDIAAEISNAETRVDSIPPDMGVPSLVLLNTYGDPVSLIQTQTEAGTPSQWRWSDTDGVHLWTPSTDLAARINAELAPPTQDSAPPPSALATPSTSTLRAPDPSATG
ncbi:MAG: hypothetical protein Q4P15_01955 [Propionibacteriaceae bacterium]|nr:hypothetical protein [Propionibacteriaceae bacterium]